MASLEDVNKLRDLIGEPDESNGWTNEKLAEIIDASASVVEAAAKVWTSKAATYATLVDVSESGSSRKLSDLHKNALAMSSHYNQAHQATLPPVTTAGPVVNRIRRSLP